MLCGFFFVGVDGVDGVCDIFESVVGECFFASGVLIHELGEIKYFVFVEIEIFFMVFAVGDPFFFSFDHVTMEEQ